MGNMGGSCSLGLCVPARSRSHGDRGESDECRSEGEEAEEREGSDRDRCCDDKCVGAEDGDPGDGTRKAEGRSIVCLCVY